MSLKIEHTPQTVNPSDELLCCFDVSKASLSLYTEYRPEPEANTEASRVEDCRVEEEIPNQTGAIEQLLGRLRGLAEEAGLEGLCVLAEPTGSVMPCRATYGSRPSEQFDGFSFSFQRYNRPLMARMNAD